jgi:hypothetical protein
MCFKDVDGFAAYLLRHPEVDLGDGPPAQCGREEVGGENVFGFGIKVGVRLGSGDS